MSALLFDTCAVIWAGNGDDLSEEATEAINRAYHSGNEVSVSAITAWELGLLVSRSRLRLTQPVNEWFRAFLKASGCRLEPLLHDILISSSFLPGSPPKDPADRMVIATARQNGMTIVTRDRQILGYAEQGHVLALRC